MHFFEITDNILVVSSAPWPVFSWRRRMVIIANDGNALRILQVFRNANFCWFSYKLQQIF